MINAAPKIQHSIQANYPVISRILIKRPLARPLGNVNNQSTIISGNSLISEKTGPGKQTVHALPTRRKV